MKECFIVTPIGDPNSDVRRETDGLVQSVLVPVLKKYEFEPVPAHQISETGSITRQVIKRIIESELVIANLTGLNPNVMYEVGIRHCARKPLIVVAREGTLLPFDLSDERTIFYRNDMSGTEEFKERLAEIIPSTIEESISDNPVYRVIDVDLIKLPEDASDSSIVTSKRLSLIENQLESIYSSVRSISAFAGRRFNPVELPPPPRPRKSYEFLYYVEKQEHLNKLTAICDERSIHYHVEMVYKDVEKFLAAPETEEDLMALEKVATELGLKRAS